MDFQALQQYAVANFSQYFSVIINTLARPALHFAPIVIQTNDRQDSIPKSGVGSQLNPQLVGFAVLSMFLGLTMNSIITKTPEGKDLLAIEVVGLLFWVIYAAMVHLFCRMAKGRGTFHETVSVTIQIFATLYVVCSSIATILAMIVLFQPIKSFVSNLGVIGEMVAENPVVLFFLIHTILLLIYLPRALKLVHDFNLLQQIAVALPTGLMVLLHGVVMVALTGVLWGVDPPLVESSTSERKTPTDRNVAPISLVWRYEEDAYRVALVSCLPWPPKT